MMYQSGVIALYHLVVQKIDLRVEKYHCATVFGSLRINLTFLCPRPEPDVRLTANQIRKLS